jgi:hypothetical protein
MMTPEYGFRVSDGKDSRPVPDLIQYYGGSHFKRIELQGIRTETLEKFHGRMLSTSNAPVPGSHSCNQFSAAVRQVFSRFASNGRLVIPISNDLTIGQVRTNVLAR